MALFTVYLVVLSALTGCKVIVGQTDFTHQTLLDGSVDYWLRWSFTLDAIDIEASAKTLGWLAFGFSRDGGMDKADVMFAYINSTTGRANVSDRYLVADGTNIQLLLDDQQDWQMLTATKNETHTTIRVRRKLITCDRLDYPITKDTMKVIFSLDTQPPTDYLHPAMHQFRGEKSVLFLDEGLAARKLGLPVGTPSIMEWNVLNDGVIMPESVTSRFQCKLIKIPMFTRKLHVVKVEPRIDPENIDLVRQLVVSLCFLNITDDYQPKDFVCGIDRPGDRNSRQQSDLFDNCTTVLAAWAIGASAFVYPDDVGYPIGPELSGRYVLLQTHYLNGPLQRRVDSSGLKFGLSDKLRKNEAGILSIGLSGSSVIPPNTASFTLFGECSSLCTKQGLPEDGITIFGGGLHTNTLGKSVKLRHIRDGVELPVIVQDDAFDPLYQENRGVYPNRKLIKADQMSLECSYATNSPGSARLSAVTTDELCFGIVHHYPRINMTSCHSEFQSNLIPAVLQLVPDTTPVSLPTQPPNNFSSMENSTLNKPDNDTLLIILLPANDTVAVNMTGNGTAPIQKRSTEVLPTFSLDEPAVSASNISTTVSPDTTALLTNLNWTSDKVIALQEFYRNSSLIAVCSFDGGNSVRETVQRLSFVSLPAPNSTCPVFDVTSNTDFVTQGNRGQLTAKSHGKSVKRREVSTVIFGLLSSLFLCARWSQ